MMGGETAISDNSKKRKISTPPDGYVCRVCNETGHWIQQCPVAKKNKKRKKSNHVPVPGVDPSKEDIEKAKEMQKIKPPQCFCGEPSRLKKVKRSHIGGETSPAIGKYFFFCMKQKVDNPCRFARPVEEELKSKKDRPCTFFIKSGGICKKGASCIFSHDVSDLPPHLQNKFNLGLKRRMKKEQGTKTKTETESKDSDEPKEEEEKKTKGSIKANDDSSDSDSDSDSSDSDSSSDSSDDEKSDKKKTTTTKAVSDSDSSSSDSDSDSDDSSSSDSDSDED